MPLVRNGREVPVHRLRPNHTVWSPPSVIFFDTETAWTEQDRSEVHRLRLWAGVCVDRRPDPNRFTEPTWGWGETPEDFAHWLDCRSIGRRTLWAYAHNLNFDLVVTRLPEALAAKGWHAKQFSLGGGAPFFRFGKGTKTLTVCDSWSWLPERLESLATRMGTGKHDLPYNDDGSELWLARCASDVELLARSVLSLMDWWDAERLGRWTISGAACGWNAMRHTPGNWRHVIDPEPELVKFDRRAVRGGRKDAAVIRSWTGGPWVELDLTRAYPTVALKLPLPVRRLRTFDSLPVDSRRLCDRRIGAIAEAVITTDVPRYPVRHSGVTWYPVGTFKTTLAGPELAWARDNGDLRSVGPGQYHQLGFALADWAGWVLDPSREGLNEVPPVGYVACKAWGRSVIGKFSGHSQTVVELEGPAPPGWAAEKQKVMHTGTSGALVRMAGRAYLVTQDLDSESAYPAVTAWVESEVRVRLGRILEALEGNWWVCDTDGLILDLENWPRWWRTGTVRLGDQPRDPIGAAQSLCDALQDLVSPLTLRPKRVFDSMRVLGPQHLVAGDVRRMSGVRGDATETEPGTFVARDWPKLRWQLDNSEPGSYTRPERVSTFRAPTVHRWVLADGSTRPAEFALSPSGENVLLPWSESRWIDSDATLAELQYPRLSRLVS